MTEQCFTDQNVKNKETSGSDLESLKRNRGGKLECVHS